jgi:hypothetical protein
VQEALTKRFPARQDSERGSAPFPAHQKPQQSTIPMKIVLAIIALLAAIPLTVLAEKDKEKDLKVRVQVPANSGVSIEDINAAAVLDMYTFKIKNSNNYAVHVSGNTFKAWGFYPFDATVKANSSELITGGQERGRLLSKIVIDKVEKKD